MPRITPISNRALAALFTVVALLVAGSSLSRRGGMVPDPAPAGAVGQEVLAVDETDLVEGIPPEAIALFESGRPWRAARVMRGFLRSTRVPTAEAILFAARAEAGWGGWTEVSEYLEGVGWLDDVGGGEGWYWLGRAREEVGRDDEAAEAYERFLAAGAIGGDHRLSAELRHGLLRLRSAGGGPGRDPLGPVAEQAPFLAEWLRLLGAESRAMAGDSAAVRSLVTGLPEMGGLRHRGRVALVRAYEAAGDAAGTVRTALALRAEGGTATQRAELSLMAARAAITRNDNATARRELRSVLSTAPGSLSARDAATLLLGLGELTIADRLTIADVDDRHGNRARAVEGFRFWLASGSGSATQREDVQLRLGRALFNAGDFAGAETALNPILGARAEVAREALLLTGRSQYRRGDYPRAFQTFDRLAAAHPGSTEGSEGLHLVADYRHDEGNSTAAAIVYRRVADEFRGSDRAGLSLMRLAGIRYLAGDLSGAAAVWEEYRRTYPSGGRWLESSYWAGRAYEDLGQEARARELYQAIRSRDPLSYYAVRASERLGVAYWPIPLSSSPPVDAGAAAQVDEWLRGMDLLIAAGLFAEAEAEVDRVVARAGNDSGARYALAEALNARGYAIRGIRIGQDLQSAGGLNRRLLRILYPFPYRELVEAESVEKGLDPYVVAALMRQESLFTARISSPVGARGLMQIMPETGAALARGVGIDGWDTELLYQPEINVHLGTRYLAEQMDRYDQSLPSVFSAYNAGPHRIDAWMAYPEFGNEELFTERIPFRETRDYVKILTRNIELYRNLYAEE